MNEATVTISGIEVKFKASGAVPRMYRNMYNRDIFFDFDKLQKNFYENRENQAASKMPVDVLTIFEDIAYTMARHADPEIPASVDDWLEQFDMFSIYEIMPVILDLWLNNMSTSIESKKNGVQPSAQ